MDRYTTYKNGGSPKLGDMISSLRLDKNGRAYDSYGIVVGFWSPISKDIEKPVVYWASTGNTRRSLGLNLELVARA